MCLKNTDAIIHLDAVLPPFTELNLEQADTEMIQLVFDTKPNNSLEYVHPKDLN